MGKTPNWKKLRVKKKKQIVCKKSAESCQIHLTRIESDFVNALLRQWDYLRTYEDVNAGEVKNDAISFKRLKKAVEQPKYNPGNSKDTISNAAAVAAAVLLEKSLTTQSEETGLDQSTEYITLADLVALEKAFRKKGGGEVAKFSKCKEDADQYTNSSLFSNAKMPKHSEAIQDRLPNCYFHAVLNAYLYNRAELQKKYAGPSLPIIEKVSNGKYRVNFYKDKVLVNTPTCAEVCFLSKGGRIRKKDDNIDYKWYWPSIVEKGYSMHLQQDTFKGKKLSGFVPNKGTLYHTHKIEALKYTPSNIGASLAISAFKGSGSTVYTLGELAPELMQFRKAPEGFPISAEGLQGKGNEQRLWSIMKRALDNNKIVIFASGPQGFEGNDYYHAGSHAFAVYGGNKLGSVFATFDVYDPHGYEDTLKWDTVKEYISHYIIED